MYILAIVGLLIALVPLVTSKEGLEENPFFNIFIQPLVIGGVPISLFFLLVLNNFSAHNLGNHDDTLIAFKYTLIYYWPIAVVVLLYRSNSKIISRSKIKVKPKSEMNINVVDKKVQSVVVSNWDKQTNELWKTYHTTDVEEFWQTYRQLIEQAKNTTAV